MRTKGKKVLLGVSLVIFIFYYWEKSYSKNIAKLWRRECYFTKNTQYKKNNQLRMIQGIISKITASQERTRILVWNRWSYQMPVTVGTNPHTNEKHMFNNTTSQSISQGRGDCDKNVGFLCTRFLHDTQGKKPVKNGLKKSSTSGSRTLMCLINPFLS